MRQHLRICSMTLALIGAIAPVFAHLIVIHTGAVRWEKQHLSIMLEVSPHGLEHESAAMGKVMTATEAAQTLVSSIHVVSHDTGRVFPMRIEDVAKSGQVVFHFELPRHVTAAALLHRPGPELGALPRQFQLRWYLRDGSGFRMIRIGPGENHAVLVRDDPVGDDPAIDPFNEPVIRIASDRESQLRILIDYPCTLLASWTRFGDFRKDAISARRFIDIRDSIADWAPARVSFRNAQRQSPGYSIASVDLLNPAGALITEMADKNYSVYTTRIRIEVLCARDAGIPWTQMSWGGFNSLLLKASVLDCRNAGESLMAVITPTQPSVKVNHADPQDVTGK